MAAVCIAELNKTYKNKLEIPIHEKGISGEVKGGIKAKFTQGRPGQRGGGLGELPRGSETSWVSGRDPPR